MAWPTACKQVSRFGVAVRASPLVRLALHAYNQSSTGLHRDQVLRSRWCVFDDGFLKPQDGTATFDVTFLFSLSVHSSVRMPAIDMLKAGDQQHEDSSSSSTTRRPPSFLDLNEPCFLCDKGARLYTITSGCGFTGPMPWSLSPPTSLNPPQHGSPPSLQ